MHLFGLICEGTLFIVERIATFSPRARLGFVSPERAAPGKNLPKELRRFGRTDAVQTCVCRIPIHAAIGV